MVSGSRAVQRAMERSGVAMVTPTAGLGAMEAALGAAAQPPLLASVPFMWSRFMQLPRNAAAPIFQEHVHPASGRRRSSRKAPEAAALQVR